MNYKFKTKPYAHQLKALELSWNKESYAYFMEMGTGKTKVLIDNMAMLYDKGKIDGALIIAPKGVIGTWYNQEIPTHLPDYINTKIVLWKKMASLFQTVDKNGKQWPRQEITLLRTIHSFSYCWLTVLWADNLCYVYCTQKLFNRK